MTTQVESVWNSLEIAKLIVGFLTPLLLLLLGIWTNRFIKRLEASQWANQKVIEKRLAIFDETSPLLNDLFCYHMLVGNWKELDPPRIIEIKRTLDKSMHINSPLFSKEFMCLYFDFMDLCFKTNTGMGKDALIRASSSLHKPYTITGWKVSWNSMFSEEDFSENIFTTYRKLMSEFAIQLGIGLHTGRPPKKGKTQKVN